MPDKVIPLDDLRLEETKTRLIDANDALVMVELRGMLARQQEQDIVIHELRRLVQALTAGQIAAVHAIETLQNNLQVLERHQVQLAKRQEMIADWADKIEKQQKQLTEDLTGDTR